MMPLRTYTNGILRLSTRAVAGVFVSCMGLAGCAVTESVVIDKVETTAQIAAPPLYLTEDVRPGQLTISPHFSLPSKRAVTGILRVTDPETYDDMPDDSVNFLWKIPRMNGGVNINFAMSRNTAVAFGLNLSTLDGLTYGGWSAGLGFFNEKENGAFRFDFGIQSTPVKYRAASRIIRSYSGSSPDTTRCFDKGVENYLNLYGALTVNTTRKTWPANLFFSAFITKQCFIDYSPHASTSYFELNGEEVASSQWMVGITPGLSFAMMEDVRLILGERIIFPFDIIEQSPYPLLQFHMQMDVTL